MAHPPLAGGRGRPPSEEASSPPPRVIAGRPSRAADAVRPKLFFAIALAAALLLTASCAGREAKSLTGDRHEHAPITGPCDASEETRAEELASPPGRPGAPPPDAGYLEPSLELGLPPGMLENLHAGEARTARLAMRNTGSTPVVVLRIELGGLARGERQLVLAAVGDEEGGGVEEPASRAFGLIMPGRTAHFTISARFPEPGEGEVALSLTLRPLDPSFQGSTMREISIPARGEDEALTFGFEAVVRPLLFTREAAEAKVGFRADHALFLSSLEAWYLRRGNATYLVEVGEAVAFPGMSLEAAALLDERQHEKVPILDERGRLQEVPHGPVLRSMLERARGMGWGVTVEEEHGRQVIRVGP